MWYFNKKVGKKKEKVQYIHSHKKLKDCFYFFCKQIKKNSYYNS